jgi:PAS domain S-box-containing protein
VDRPLNVLLVEDNPDDVFLMRTMLKRASLAHSLVVLEDGAQAIDYMRQLAEQGPEAFPDLMFIDLNLPRRNGHEVLAEIRAHHSLDKLPIVVLTTSEDPADMAKALDRGALRYTSKPPNLEVLRQILKEADLDGLGAAPKAGAKSEAAALQVSPAAAAIGPGGDAKPEADWLLLIEDNPHDALFFKEILRKTAPGAYQLEVSTDVASALAMLPTRPFKVILADLGLPDAHGLEVLTKLREVAEKIPVVIMTGLDDEKRAAEAVEKGAQDYLVKGNVDGDRLVRSIRYAVMRKRADELARLAITIENNALKEMLEHAPLSIARFDSNLNILACNSVFARQVEVAQGTVLGIKVNQLLPLTDLDLWQKVVTNGVPFHQDQCKLRKDSELTWDLTAWPVKSSEGDIKGGITIGVDITERIKIERQRADFASALAHDIANPLVGVDRILTALSETPLGQADIEQDNFLTMLKDSNSNVLAMLHNLLDVYRYDTAAVQLHIQTVDLLPSLNSAIASTRAAAAAKQVSVVLDATGDLAKINADAQALHRLFVNLLENAVQFSPNGAQVGITAQNSENGVSIEINDHGPVISEDEQGRLFKRFGQDGEHQLQVGPGNRLGLYLCKQIVDAHGGSIVCCSTAQSGNTFKITLL